MLVKDVKGEEEGCRTKIQRTAEGVAKEQDSFQALKSTIRAAKQRASLPHIKSLMAQDSQIQVRAVAHSSSSFMSSFTMPIFTPSLAKKFVLRLAFYPLL